MKGIGLKGIGVSPLTMKGGNYGLSPWDFDPVLVSFTPSMAKRATSVFAASPILQGKRDHTPIGDNFNFSRGTLVAGTNFYTNLDGNQGSLVFWITPEWDGTDGGAYLYYNENGGYALYVSAGGGTLNVNVGAVGTIANIAGWVAGTTYCAVIRWDINNTLDGTNYICISINDVHTFGCTTKPALVVPNANSYLGYYPSTGGKSCNAVMQGVTLYRRVLYDGTYGVNVGNGDEVNLISAGVDPTTVTGSWDVVFCLPTNATAGALVTGTGEAWSHPHSSNLLTRGFLSDKYYGGGAWGVKLVGTGDIDCGSGATLDDLGAGGAIFQAEGWFRVDNTSLWPTLIFKANTTNALNGWRLFTNSTGILSATVDLATTDVNYTSTATVQIGKWHHILLHYNDTTKVAQIALDGVWVAASSAGSGAYQTDAAQNFHIGRGDSRLTGSVGWVRIHNHAHYTPGTNFLPPRAFPGADAGTVEAWALSEGTGTTATASVTTPANDGTITNGTWEPQWYDEGTPVRLRSVVGGANYIVNVGSDAAIDDLADGAFTAEGWFRIAKSSATQMLFGKGSGDSNGWKVFVRNTGQIQVYIRCTTTDAASQSTLLVNDGYWHYIKITFDDAGDRKADIFVDNVEVSYNSQIAGVDAIKSDAASNGYISTTSEPISAISAHGWIRWSNVVRGAGMIPRSNPPAVDANTVGQWNCTEGAGTVLDNAEGTATRDGNITGNFSWQNSPAMESDSPGARNYAWGYVFGVDTPNEGFKQTISGSSAGADYVIRALGYSEDGLGIPGLVVYDETNSFILKTVLGTTGSTERTPDVLMCSFELPTTARYTGTSANCSVFSVKIINAGVTGSVVGFQQVELLANLLDNPSLDTGAVADPWIPYGWTNDLIDAGDTEIETVLARSGGACFQANAGFLVSTTQS